MLTIRLYGFFNLLIGSMLLLLALGNRYAASHGGHDLQSLTIPAFFICVVGACLLTYRSWSVGVAMCLGVFVIFHGISRSTLAAAAIECVYSSMIVVLAAYYFLLHCQPGNAPNEKP
jgi:hypothetical protein